MDIYYKYLDSDGIGGYVLLCPKKDFDETGLIEETKNYKKMREILDENDILYEDEFVGEFSNDCILEEYEYKCNENNFVHRINDEKEFLEADDEAFKECVLDRISELKLNLNFIKNNELTWTNTKDIEEKTVYYELRIESYNPYIKIYAKNKYGEMSSARVDILRILRLNTYNSSDDRFFGDFILCDSCETRSTEYAITKLKELLWNSGRIRFEPR